MAELRVNVSYFHILTTPSILFYKTQVNMTRSSKLHFDHLFIFILYYLYLEIYDT